MRISGINGGMRGVTKSFNINVSLHLSAYCENKNITRLRCSYHSDCEMTGPHIAACLMDYVWIK